ncbi:hypothetical protein Tco_0235813 [Tanacetum coccineum]
MWDIGMTHAGSGVAYLSLSGIGFNHSGLYIEHLECQTSSMLMTEELAAMMNQKHQRHVVFSYLDPNLVEEEDLDHHVIFYETYPFQ